jgi:hypothetical protein
MALHGVLQAGEQDTSRVEAGNTGAVVGKLRPADRAGITEVPSPCSPSMIRSRQALTRSGR